MLIKMLITMDASPDITKGEGKKKKWKKGRKQKKIREEGRRAEGRMHHGWLIIVINLTGFRIAVETYSCVWLYMFPEKFI